MPHSHHSHSGQFCSHAKDTLSEVLSRAHSLGFTHFHLSEHVPRHSLIHLYPEEIEAGKTPEDLEATFSDYLTHARQLQSSYMGKMEVLVGCESENIKGDRSIDELLRILSDHQVRGGDPLPTSNASLPSSSQHPSVAGLGVVDYVVGSVHHSNSIPIDFDPPTFQKALDSFQAEAPAAAGGNQDGDMSLSSYDRLMIDYFDSQYDTMKRLRPEVIGHFDLCRLYFPSKRLELSRKEAISQGGGDGGDQEEDDPIWSRVRRNVEYAASYGALFECNAASFRKGWSSAYPGKEVLELIKAVRGRLCLSDDSHGVQAVALNYHKLRPYLRESGVEEIWYLERDDERRAIDIEAEEALRLERIRSEAPGTGAPTRFPRGTKAIRMGREWMEHAFWDRYEAIVGV
ncbi:histidinol phosphate phosphatase H [Violaceomyces palustris]|uniref:Histidinol phosphate phosphatase H n=1 Tax=Violaceomyces palustris TaxID=1673888 RepID=A0ACD0P3I3_9BASI|nr:histidinol phosphate phosphatase H [Violaceomyces palustris]